MCQHLKGRLLRVILHRIADIDTSTHHELEEEGERKQQKDDLIMEDVRTDVPTQSNPMPPSTSPAQASDARSHATLCEADVLRLFACVGLDTMVHTVGSISHYHAALLLSPTCHDDSSSSSASPTKRRHARAVWAGDFLLTTIVGRYLIRRIPTDSPAALARLREKLLSRERLGELARTMGLEDFLPARARSSSATCAATFKAIVSAVHDDGRAVAARHLAERTRLPQPARRSRYGAQTDALLRSVTPDAFGFSRAEQFVVGALERFVDFCEVQRTESNFKDILTKHFQQHFKIAPTYRATCQDATPADAPLFSQSVYHVNGDLLGTGTGTTKREARHEAARAALQRLGVPAQYVPSSISNKK